MGEPCRAIIGKGSRREGEICGRDSLPGRDRCGYHLGAEHVKEMRDEMMTQFAPDTEMPPTKPSIKELEARCQALTEALEKAADDLGKAANQFAGLPENVNNARIFTEKESRARAALKGEGES